ncbi:Similar to Cdk2ap1: Cyclin-dependent kinase 2-associated protein 1 (Mus musculus) [Cotesia congregata]|uniref:Similar to Cdk2ap1: Cyclin-dependent kinase 2-associated protein 1 (Mus musculus) n=1 Tax=Cotesia congregata TaxID=51543 RepID=A0A8J2HGS9_COTCN|nr:Similar to Cdk2ap1: Cyclin-dependent kinase 2-associated protein 1 (Mus musculus) [Cotesia congregata]
MYEFENGGLMSETAEERAIRLYTAAERMKNVRAKESEDQAALRRMQEAQRMARHRAKKKRCLDENLAREISKIAELSKMPDAATIAQMSEMNMNKISAELKQMMERGKVPEHIVQMAQLAEFSKMTELNKMSQDMAKRYEMEKMAEYAKTTEYMKMQEIAKMSELAKMNEMVKYSEMAKYSNDISKMNEIAKMNEMMKISQMAKINEVQRMNEIAKLNEMVKMTEMAKYNDMTKYNEIAQINEMAKEFNVQSAQVQNVQASPSSTINFPSVPGQGKYAQLLVIIEELGRDIRLSYAGSRSAAERLKMGIQHARILVRECLLETEHNARQ